MPKSQAEHRRYQQQLIQKYRDYANSDEAYAVLFVKQYVKQAQGMWIEVGKITEHRYFEHRKLEFKGLVFRLFKREQKPVYPPKVKGQSEQAYQLLCRAITWECAHADIDAQKSKGIVGKAYRIEGVRFYQPQSFFVDHAPAHIQQLAQNLHDRTDPLWDEAMPYIRKGDGYRFKIKQITRLK